jgi:signal transduction histidine kinase
MKHLRENLLVQFSLASLMIMLILALVIFQVLTAGFSQVIGLLQQHQAAMPSNPIDERAPFSIPSLEREVRNLSWMVYGVMGGGFIVLYAGLVAIVWRGWKTMTRQRAALEIARDAALEASRAKSSFMVSTSHELRTPLNAIIGYSKLLQEKVEMAGPPGLQDDLDKIHSATQHLLGLINNLLDLSKIEAAQVDVHLGRPDGQPADEGKGN